LSLVKVECLPKKLTWKTIVDKAGASVDESSIIKSLVYMHNLRTNLYAVPGYLNRSEKGIYAADATLLPISVCVPSLPFSAVAHFPFVRYCRRHRSSLPLRRVVLLYLKATTATKTRTALCGQCASKTVPQFSFPILCSQKLPKTYNAGGICWISYCLRTEMSSTNPLNGAKTYSSYYPLCFSRNYALVVGVKYCVAAEKIFSRVRQGRFKAADLVKKRGPFSGF